MIRVSMCLPPLRWKRRDGRCLLRAQQCERTANGANFVNGWCAAAIANLANSLHTISNHTNSMVSAFGPGRYIPVELRIIIQPLLPVPVHEVTSNVYVAREKNPRGVIQREHDRARGHHRGRLTDPRRAERCRQAAQASVVCDRYTCARTYHRCCGRQGLIPSIS